MNGGYSLKLNTAKYGQLIDETIAQAGKVAFFDGVSNKPGTLEAKQWLEAILNDGTPLVKPEQAFVVTRILEAIYHSHQQKREILL